MNNGYMLIKRAQPLSGTAQVYGAKNAVLVIMTSLILTDGKSVLENVPNNADVRLMIELLESLGATINFDINKKQLTVDTFGICHHEVSPEIMNKMRASILVMGPLLARFDEAKVALPGGDLIGLRPINYHLDGFKKFGISINVETPYVNAQRVPQETMRKVRIVLEYPSVGATENLLMYACLGSQETIIVNAAFEPEVFDLIEVLKKMGAMIEILPSATLYIKGVQRLNSVNHTIVPDRLEVGALLMAAAITHGEIAITNARADHLDIVLEKLKDMGHHITTHLDIGRPEVATGIHFKATQHPQAVTIKTAPYPGFPTDLQPSMMAILSLAEGISTVEETVYENRMLHVKELGKMGAQISLEGTKSIIRGVEALYGCEVIASDIRASCALVLCGMVAYGQTKMTGVSHWLRGYDRLEERLCILGASVELIDEMVTVVEGPMITQKPLL